MAPTEAEVEWQTGEIVKYFLEDNPCSPCCGSTVESDGPGDSNDDFDPAAIADKLRAVADKLHEDTLFKAALNDLRKAAMQEAADAAFSQGVQALCQAKVPQSPELSSEMQLIKASAALGNYVMKSCPELKLRVQHAMTTFLNTHVRSWLTKQGGWKKVDL